jgi:Predicted P-loop ATPase fused to an acetyltransferase
MYQYYKGLIIREGTYGISGQTLRKLYLEIGWCNNQLPQWQNEKFEIALHNSAWAFSVWDGEELIGVVRVVSDRIMVASIQDLMVKERYRKQGIGKKLVELSIQKLPCGNWSARTTPEYYKFYGKCGFVMPNANNTSLEYNGYLKARADGDR